MENVSSEHFTPKQTSQIELAVNMERYIFATQFLEGKTVLDLGCGSGLGTYLYSLVAEKVYALDYDANAIEEAKKWPFPKDNVEFIHLDLTDPDTMGKLPAVDVCVANEVLEHIEEPVGILRELKANKLVFCVPLYSLEMSSWHKYDIQGEADVRKLIQPYYQIGKYQEQRHKQLTAIWMLGEGTRYEGN